MTDRAAGQVEGSLAGVVAVVPYRADESGTRRRNLEVVLRWLADTGLSTVLVEHTDEPEPGLTVPVPRVLVAAHGRPFSKAAACNAGFVAARRVAARGGRVAAVALVDADTLMPSAPFMACAAAVAHGEFDALRPFGRLVELDEHSTAAVAAGAPLPVGPTDIGEARDDNRAGEVVPMCGGLVIVRAEAYEDAGGMDESFEGWGGEDDAFSAALLRSGARAGIHRGATAVHLAHPRAPEARYGHEHYARNRDRARWWHEAPEAELEVARAIGRARLRMDP